MKNEYLEEKEIQKRLSEQLNIRRGKLGFSQVKVAMLLKKSQSTYQRWETRGQNLPNVSDLLKVFRILDFSLTEIMEVLGLPRPDADELKKLCQDENIEKAIKEASLYSYVRKNCPDLGDMEIEKLLDTLFAERLKRHNAKTS